MFKELVTDVSRMILVEIDSSKERVRELSGKEIQEIQEIFSHEERFRKLSSGDDLDPFLSLTIFKLEGVSRLKIDRNYVEYQGKWYYHDGPCLGRRLREIMETPPEFIAQNTVAIEEMSVTQGE